MRKRIFCTLIWSSLIASVCATPIENQSTQSGALGIGDSAVANLQNSIALGKDAGVVNENGSSIGGIAIGTAAKSHNMPKANHEKLILFGRDASTLNGGIAIGAGTHARISTIDIGNRDYIGEIGDSLFDNTNPSTNTWNTTTGIGNTTIGDNSINMSNFGTINGAFNLISKSTDVSTSGGNSITRGLNALRNAGGAIQGFGSTITGTLNSIEANEPLSGNMMGVFGGDVATGLMYSGFNSNVLGMANRINKSNGVIIIGSGNEITNSYLKPNQRFTIDSLSMNSFLGTVSVTPGINISSVKDIAEGIRKYTRDNRLASVGAIGSANSIDHALFSMVSGVGNTLHGVGGTTLQNNTYSDTKELYDSFSAFNSINGYENQGTNITKTLITGMRNAVTNGVSNIVIGHHNTLNGTDETAAEGNIILSNESAMLKESAKNIVSIGTHVSGETDESVYLGSYSKNAIEGRTAGITEYKSVTISDENSGDNELHFTFSGGTPIGIVSVGSEGKERRIQNVAAGLISENSTDAINGSQLYAAIKHIRTSDMNVVTKGGVDVLAGDNIEIVSSLNSDGDTTFTVATKKDVTFQSVKLGDVTIDKQGVSILHGPNISSNGIDAGNKKITHVAAGTEDMDAVNYGQLKGITNTIDRVSHRVDSLNQQLHEVGAQSAALSALKTLDYDSLEPTQIMAGYGYYAGKSAIAIGVAHYKNESNLYHAGLSITSDINKVMINVGATWKVGSGSKASNIVEPRLSDANKNTYEIQEELTLIKNQNQQLLSLIKSQEMRIQAQEEKIAMLMARE